MKHGNVIEAHEPARAISKSYSMRRHKLTGSVKTLIGGVVWILVACWFWHSLAGKPLHELALIQKGQTVAGFIVDTWEDAERRDIGGTQWTSG
jgi:hypothetical protein